MPDINTPKRNAVVNNAGVFFLAFSYGTLAYAQAKIERPGFGDELIAMPWYVWALVFGFGLWGVGARLFLDISKGLLKPSFSAIGAIILIGMLSSLAAYGVCEFIKSRYNVAINDVMQCGIIAICGYNHRLVLAVMTRKLKDVFYRSPFPTEHENRT